MYLVYKIIASLVSLGAAKPNRGQPLHQMQPPSGPYLPPYPPLVRDEVEYFFLKKITK